MNTRYAIVLLAASFGLWALKGMGQCAGTGMGATTSVPVGNWSPATVPPNTSITLTGSTVAGSNVLTVSGTGGLPIGTPITGTNIPAGTTITSILTGVTLQMSANATGTIGSASYTFTLPAYTSNAPPTSGGTPNGVVCSVCPSLFTATMNTSQWVPYQMCAGNIYTISLCNTTPSFNSTLTIAFGATFATTYAFDDDGCGTTNGLSTITFVPTITQLYRIRVFNDPCTINPLNNATIQITCSPVPAPPPNDNPCTAQALTVGTACNLIGTTASWATYTTGVPVPTCGNFGGYDVWYTAVVPASGNLSVQTALGSATDLAMAIYTATPNCSGTFTQWACNDNAAPGNLQPFITTSGLPGGSTVYIRVWPEGGLAANGTFQICAYEPIPPPNDNPCGAAPTPLIPGCSPGVYTTESATPLQGNITTTPATPSCGTPVAGGDVWFAVTAPATGALTINTFAGTLSDMAMALYSLSSGTICGPATMTELACNDNSPLGGNMPRLSVGALTPGQTYYARVWNKTTAFGTFSICAFENTPPPNDNPCGAISLTAQYGCLFQGFTTEYATQTPTVIGSGSIPNPSCGGVPNNDVWFTTVVPPNGVLQFDTDDGLMNDAAMAVYNIASGTCGGNNLSLSIAGCATTGSLNGNNMPYLSVSGLVPGTTVYVRVWRQANSEGTFQICARRTDPPPGNCSYILTMNDTGSDGWNGSQVQICVGGVCTNYSINGGYGQVIFGATLGQLITITYTSVGGFQNQISYTVTTPNGALLYGSGLTPPTGLVYAFLVDANCNVPPAPPSDCIGSFEICNSQQFSGNPSNTGGVVDLNSSNDGCLSMERQGLWFTFTVSQSGTLAFSIVPTSPSYTDYDWAVWGPYTGAPICPPASSPMRCSWAGTGAATGTNFTATDLSEGAGGDAWIQYINGVVGQTYLLYVDNWSMNGISFNFNWNPAMTGDVSCLVLPLEFMDFNATGRQRQVDLDWRTASEQNTAFFQVERSTDGREFIPLGQVEAAGNTSNLTSYAFTDLDPVKGLNYYRLMQVDQDGAFTYSNVAIASFDGVASPLTVFPNPATDLLNAAIETVAEGQVRWRIIDGTGRQVAEGAQAMDRGMGRMEIPLGGVEVGHYILELLDAQGTPLGNARFVRQ